MSQYMVTAPAVVCLLMAASALPAHAQASKITTVAGTGVEGYAGDNGAATSATLKAPRGLALDSAGDLIIADPGCHCIRKVYATGTIVTFAGNGMAGRSGDNGAATVATLNSPVGVGVDGADNVYVVDMDNHTVRTVTPGGRISAFAGIGSPGFRGDGLSGLSVQFNYPQGLVVDVAGNVHIADTDNQRIRRSASSGYTSTKAGNGTAGYGGDGGAPTSAMLNSPKGVVLDSSGNLYIADAGNHVIRKISAGVISTIAGTGKAGFGGDSGAATAAQLNNPSAIAIDRKNNIYIADTGNHRVRKVDAVTGVITTIAGTGTAGFNGDGGAATDAQLNGPLGVLADSAGSIYISDTGNHRVRKVTFASCTATLDTAGAAFSAEGGSGTVTVTTGDGCPWSATSDSAEWLAIENGAAGSGSGKLSYSVAAYSGEAPRTGRLTVAGLAFTVTQAAPLPTVTTVSAASWQGPAAAPDVLMTSIGKNLASETASAENGASTLAGVSISFTDSAGTTGEALISMVSPGQVNWVLPSWAVNGTATLKLTTGSGVVMAGSVEVGEAAPGLFSANNSGTGAAAGYALQADGNGGWTTLTLSDCGTVEKSCAAKALDPAAGDLIVILNATGIRHAAAVKASTNGTELEVLNYRGHESLAGVDLVAVRLPPEMAGAGDVPIVLSSGEQVSNSVEVRLGPAALKLSALTPQALLRDKTTHLTLTGESLAGVTGLISYPPDGLTVSGVTANETAVEMDVTVAADAVPGVRMVAATTAAGRSDALKLAITGAPKISTVSPNELTVGETNTLIITGESLETATGFVFSPEAGTTVSDVIVTATQVKATVTVDAGAASGKRNVAVATPVGNTNVLALTVFGSEPAITAVTPPRAAPGQTLVVTIVGRNLANTTGLQFSPADGITVTDLAASAKTVTATISVAWNVTLGARTMAVLTGAGASNAVEFTLFNPAPKLTGIYPVAAKAGSTFHLTLAGTGLAAATAIEFSPAAGITITDMTASETRITATVKVDATATTGTRGVRVMVANVVSNALELAIRPDYTGAWKGVTDQNRTMGFTVSGSDLSGLTMVVLGGCLEVTFLDFTATIDGDSFTISKSDSIEYQGVMYTASLEIAGTFTSSTAVAGTYTWSYPFCRASGKGTWSATRQ